MWLAQRFFATSKPLVKLFTPGPLNTTESVRSAMMYDYGSRDPDFGRIVEDIKLRLLKAAGVSPRDFATVLVQGSGTFAVEAALQSSFPTQKDYEKPRLMLIATNGAYGERQVSICEYANIPHIVIRFGDDEPVNAEAVRKIVQDNPQVTHVSVIHSETTAGLLNPVEEIGKAVKSVNPDVQYIVDAMSSFGAVHVDFDAAGIDYLISSSNKMFQGTPGFAYVIAKLNRLRNTKGNARALVLDLYSQWDYQLENPGQFRFTPPTHVLASFHQALVEHEQEGGVKARGEKYFGNQKLISELMLDLGFELYVDPKNQGCVITTFIQPDHPNFNFKTLYEYLAQRNFVIYPGKLAKLPTFRLGCIGEIYEEDIHALIAHLKDAFDFMGVPLPLKKN